MDAEAAPRSRVRTAALVIGLLLVGLVARSVVVDGSDSPLVSWLPWNRTITVTLYFGEPSGEYLVPVSRELGRGETDPTTLVDALFAGPEPDTGLIGLVPEGTDATTTLADGVLSVDLGGSYATEATSLTHEAVFQSLRQWPDVSDVVVTVDGAPLETNSSGHLLYWYDEARDRLVAERTNRVRPGDLLEAYLTGPDDPDLIGLPDAVQSTEVDLGTNELLTLRFTFPDALQEFAVDNPESVRRVLEGLIATFNTGFPEVGGVLLDFDGHNALGLGQCANLLNTLQQMPEVLNDERVLSRYAESA